MGETAEAQSHAGCRKGGDLQEPRLPRVQSQPSLQVWNPQLKLWVPNRQVNKLDLNHCVDTQNNGHR